jgi:hypothetical protein
MFAPFHEQNVNNILDEQLNPKGQEMLRQVMIYERQINGNKMETFHLLRALLLSTINGSMLIDFPWLMYSLPIGLAGTHVV